MASCSPPSRRGLPTPEYVAREERRPTLTASARAANGLPSRKGYQRAAAASPLLTKEERISGPLRRLSTAWEQIRMRQYAT